MADELPKQRRLAAIMFTDMVGYSAISQRNEALALELLDEHRGLLRKSFARHGGHEIEAVGDGFFVEFLSALAAAHCAAEIQRLLHERNLAQPPERQILLRIGLHLGDVVALVAGPEVSNLRFGAIEQRRRGGGVEQIVVLDAGEID